MTDQKAWPANAIEGWPIARLKAYERNARTHSADQVAKISASIREFGFTNPVLALEDGTIIAGHDRAAQRIRLVIDLAGRRPAQMNVKADRLGNRVAVGLIGGVDFLRLRHDVLHVAGASMVNTSHEN